MRVFQVLLCRSEWRCWKMLRILLFLATPSSWKHHTSKLFIILKLILCLFLMQIIFLCSYFTCDEEKEICIPGASYLVIEFDPRCKTERKRDFLELVNPYGNLALHLVRVQQTLNLS